METNVSKEKLAELTKRIYVFPYRVIEDNEYETVFEDGVPLHLTEEELVWFAEHWKDGSVKWNGNFEDKPEWLSEKLVNGVSKEAEDKMQDYDVCSILFNFMPLELELAMQEITGQKSKDNEYYFDAENYEFGENEYLPATIRFAVDGKEYVYACNLRLDLANVMLAVMDNAPADASLFNYMKAVAAEAYNYIYKEVYDYFIEACESDNIKDSVVICFKDFPEEVKAARCN